MSTNLHPSAPPDSAATTAADARSSGQEIEAKFSVTDRAQSAARIDGALLANRYPLGAARQVVNVDTYFDTSDLRLLRQGQTLRTRTQGDALVVTSKSIGLHTPKGLHSRAEIERPAPGVHADALLLRRDLLPGEVAEVTADLVANDEPLLPLVRLHQERTKRMVCLPDGGPLAELSLDDITVLRPPSLPEGEAGHEPGDPEPAAWSPVTTFHELEIELLPGGDKAELKQVAAAVRELPGLKANDQNKLQQALLALGSADAAAAGADSRQPIAELCRRVWREQLAVMLVNEAGVRFSDDIEYVHDMRVATRRARAAARLYAGFFDPKSKQVKRFLKRLRTTGRLLGRVRDLDVALKRLDGHASRLDGGAREGLDGLARLWAKERARAHAALLDWLDSKTYARFVHAFRRFCTTPGAGLPRLAWEPHEPPPPYQIRHLLPSLIFNRYEAIRAFEVPFEQHAADGTPLPVETLHALRIECKYLRYHLEFNETLLGDEGQEMIAALRQLQEDLGDLNDASVSAEMLARARRRVDGDGLATYEALQHETVGRLRATVPADIAGFLSAETRRTLARAVARI